MLQPGPYATLHYVPQSREVLGHTAHWRVDGIGVFMLLNSLLELAAQPDLADPWSLPWGSEAERLAPAVEEAARMPETPSPAQEAVDSFTLVTGAVGIPYLGDAATVPYYPQALAPPTLCSPRRQRWPLSTRPRHAVSASPLPSMPALPPPTSREPPITTGGDTTPAPSASICAHPCQRRIPPPCTPPVYISPARWPRWTRTRAGMRTLAPIRSSTAG